LVAHATIFGQTPPVPTRTGGREVEELRRLVQRLFRRFGALASDATPCGMPISIPHAHALMLLLGGDELSQQALGAELCIDKSNVARLCAKMVAAGHVVQRPADADGRSRLVSLTAKGERVAQQVESASTTRFGSVLRGLPADARPSVLTALQHLLASVEAVPSPVTSQERTDR
jgi:DNA-binding MarR family transcriptional regulator